MTATELALTGNFINEIPEATAVGVLADEVAATGLAVALLHCWDVAATGGQARVRASSLHGGP